MSLRRNSVLWMMRVARPLFKNTSFENNSVMLALYRLAYWLGFSGGAAELQFIYMGLSFVAPKSDISMGPGLLNQTYETHELIFVKQFLRPGMVFIDVGANIGLYSKVAAMAVGGAGQVIAFEPSPTPLQFLRRNLKEHPQVRIIEKGVGAMTEKATLYIPDKEFGCGSVITRNGHPTEIQIVSLDDFFQDNPISRRIDLIKMDIEGYELEAIAGMKTLCESKPVILMEFNPSFLSLHGADPVQTLRRLREDFGEVLFFHEASGELEELHTVEQLGHQLIANLLLNYHSHKTV